MMATQADKAREKLISQFDKSYGKGSMSRRDRAIYKTISTGSLALDQAMSVGGYVIGRETEIWGPPAGGKSSLALIAAGNAQRQFPDRDVIYVDVEHTFDPDWARTLGADPARILHIDPLTAENTADMVKDSIKSNLASLVIVDSIGAVLTTKEFEKAADESDMGKRAQVVSRMILIATGLAPRHEVAVLVINQARANFGYGASTKPSGGFVPAHAPTHRLNVKRASTPYTIGSDENQINVGYEMGVKIERSKVGPEGRNVKFDFYTVATDRYGPVGIDKTQEAFKVGKREGIIAQGGAWYTLPDGKKLQGEGEVITYLAENPKLLDKIRNELLTKVKGEIKSDSPPELTKEQAKEAGIL